MNESFEVFWQMLQHQPMNKWKKLIYLFIEDQLKIRMTAKNALKQISRGLR